MNYPPRLQPTAAAQRPAQRQQALEFLPGQTEKRSSLFQRFTPRAICWRGAKEHNQMRKLYNASTTVAGGAQHLSVAYCYRHTSRHFSNTSNRIQLRCPLVHPADAEATVRYRGRIA